jgi:hypothetical protein
MLVKLFVKMLKKNLNKNFKNQNFVKEIFLIIKNILLFDLEFSNLINYSTNMCWSWPFVWNPGWALSTLVCPYCILGICKRWEFVANRPMTITRESKLYFISKNKGCQLCEHKKGMSWKHTQSSSSVFFFGTIFWQINWENLGIFLFFKCKFD